MTPDQARQIIIEAMVKTKDALNNPAVAEALRDPEGDVKLSAVGMDSLDQVDLCMEIETAIGVDLDLAEMSRCTRLSDLVNYLVGVEAKALER